MLILDMVLVSRKICFVRQENYIDEAATLPLYDDLHYVQLPDKFNGTKYILNFAARSVLLYMIQS